MNNQKVLYEELRPEEFLERINACPIAYLPMGTLEWHGLHLPLGADGLQAKGFFSALAEEVGGIVLPMLFLAPEKIIEKDNLCYVGMDFYSFEDDAPQQLEGTAYYVDEALFVSMLEATIWNLKRAGFKIIVAHGHGPSNQTFANHIQEFEQKFDIRLLELWDVGGRGDQGIQTDHAAFNETSLVMGLRPELADLDRLAQDSDMIGVWGLDPRQTASETMGQTIIANQVNIVAEILRSELAKLTWPTRKMDYEKMKKLWSPGVPVLDTP